MEKVIQILGISFCLTLILMAICFHFMYEPKVHPSWYGTYYSLQDAMEDGWYENN